MKNPLLDQIMKKIKVVVVLYYKSVLGKPFIRKEFDNNHLSPFKTVNKSRGNGGLAAYRGLWVTKKY